MMKPWIVHVTVIIALVSAMISPACAFVSGQSPLMQICISDGTVKQTQAPEELQSYFLTQDQAQDQPQPDEHGVKQECPFCLAFHTQKLQKPDVVMAALPAMRTNRLKTGAGSFIFISQDRIIYNPRGPPQPLS